MPSASSTIFEIIMFSTASFRLSKVMVPLTLRSAPIVVDPLIAASTFTSSELHVSVWINAPFSPESLTFVEFLRKFSLLIFLVVVVLKSLMTI